MRYYWPLDCFLTDKYEQTLDKVDIRKYKEEEEFCDICLNAGGVFKNSAEYWVEGIDADDYQLFILALCEPHMPRPYLEKTQKYYGSIPHLSGSKFGRGDHGATPGQERILTEKVRDKHDNIIVAEKCDGSACGVIKVDGYIHAVLRSGYLARSSPFRQHHLFDQWVTIHYHQFYELLEEGERVMGEWLALVHGTFYSLQERSPFVIFDLFHDGERIMYNNLTERLALVGLTHVPILSEGPPVPVEKALNLLSTSGHYGAINGAEGVVYRVERQGKVDFLAKYVRQEKIPGEFLSGVNNNTKDTWNWLPFLNGLRP